MAQKTEAEKKAEEEANRIRNEETVRLAAEIGRDDGGLMAGLNEADPFEKMVTFMPGKPGFDKPGVSSFLGKFVRNKRVVNEKSPWARIDTDQDSATYGKRIVNLMVLEDGRGNKFGIWGVGAIRAAAQCLRTGDVIRITYRGVADEALKPNQNPPHLFKFEGKRADGTPLKFDWDAVGDDDVEVPHTSTATAAAPSARQ